MRPERTRLRARTPRLAIAVAGVCIGMPAGTASGATSTWSGLGSYWSFDASWSPAVAPANDGTADIVMTGSSALRPTVDLPWSIRSLTFNALANPFEIGGTTLTIGAGGITNQSSTVQRLYVPVVLSADQTWNVGVGQNNVGVLQFGPVDTNGHLLTVGGNASGLIDGIISGSGGLRVTIGPSHSIGVYRQNTYTGGTFLKGKMSIEGEESLGAPVSVLTFDGGELGISRSTTISRDIVMGPAGGRITSHVSQGGELNIASRISGTGKLTLFPVSESYTVRLTGRNSHTGGTLLHQGRLSGTTDSIQGNVSLGLTGAAKLELRQDFDGVLHADIDGGRVEKRGAGAVTLTGGNIGNGFDLYEGVVEVTGNGEALPPTLITFAGGVIQMVGAGTLTRDESRFVGGGFSARNGKLVVNLGGNAAPIISGGTWYLGSRTANDVTEVVNPFDYPKTFQVDAGVGGDYAVLSGPITGGNGTLVKRGDGILRLTATNSFTGGLSLYGGATYAAEGVGLPSAANLSFAGGVHLADDSATFTRPLGIGAGQVRWLLGGGFAATTGTYTINIGGTAAPVAWGGNFVQNTQALIFGYDRAGGEVLFLNPIDLVGVREVKVIAGTGTGRGTLAGVLSGFGGLRKTGGGILALNSTNTYRGGTTIVEGLLRTNADGALGPGGSLTFGAAGTNGTLDLAGHVATVTSLAVGAGANAPDQVIGNSSTTSDATLIVDTLSANSTFGGLIRDSLLGGTRAVGLTKRGTRTLTFISHHAYTGTTTVERGTLALDFTTLTTPTNLLDPASALRLAGGTLSVKAKASEPNGQSFSTVTLASNTQSFVTVNRNGATALNLSLGTVDRRGGATVDLPLPSGASVTTASTTFSSNGILVSAATGGTAFATVANAHWAANASGSLGIPTYQADYTDPGSNIDVGAGASPSAFTVNTLRFHTAAGKLVLDGSGASTVSTGGVLVTFFAMGAKIDSGGPGAALRAGAGRELVIINNGSLSVAAPIVDSDAGTSSLTHAGIGTTTLTGANTYTGSTIITGGTLQIGSGGETGSILGDVTNDSSLVFNRSGTITQAGAVSGVGTLTKSGPGTLVLTASHTYTGVTTISGGAIQLGDGGTGGSLVSAVTNNGSLIFNRTDSVIHSSAVSGTGSVTKLGPGTLTLAGDSLYSGATNVVAGTLLYGKSFTSGSSLDVSDGATLAIGLSAATKAVLRTKSLDAHTSGTVDVSNNVLILTSADPAAGLAKLRAYARDGFDGGTWDGPHLASSAAGAPAGTGVAVLRNVADNGTSPLFTQFAGQTVGVNDVLVSYAISGDTDLDRDVDLDDYARIDAGFLSGGTQTGWRWGDLNYDDRIDADDYWLADVGFLKQKSVNAAPAATVAPVPEPCSAFALTLAALGSLARRGSRRFPIGTAISHGGRRTKPVYS